MRRKLLCGLAACVWPLAADAQVVPVRDLWDFPLGAVLEPAALATEPGAGLWNPAAIALSRADHWRFGVASVARQASDQSVGGQLLSISRRGAYGTTLGFSVARMSLGDIVRTDADPQSLGTVPYSSMLYSVVAARRLVPHVTGGIAVRVRQGQADNIEGHAVSADLGFVADSLPFRDARVALASFLWRPGREIDDRPGLTLAADVRVFGSGSNSSRLGYSYFGVNRGQKEHGPFASVRRDLFEGRAAYVTSSGAGGRFRYGMSLHYARFVVGLARENGTSGLSELYQFTLSSFFK